MEISIKNISKVYTANLIQIYSIKYFKLGLLEECNLIGLA